MTQVALAWRRALLVWLCAIGLFAFPSAVAAQESILHPVFSDHAVLQRDRAIPIWGQAAPRERITVEFAGRTTRTRADARGMWRVMLPARPAGGPYELSVRTSSGASQRISDVLVGDVYLCSGQSNMEFQTRYATNAESVLNGADSDRIRLFTVPRATAASAQTAFAEPTAWRRADHDSAGEFSAVCYFFAREIETAAQAPIGLIHSSWGGTRIEAWMSEAAISGVGGFEGELASLHESLADPDGAAARYQTALRAWWSEHDPGGRAGWGNETIDAQGWAPFTPGGFWEAAGVAELARFDGTAWFRRTFTLTSEQAAQAAELTIGPVDDVDITSINGVIVGSEPGWDSPRRYTVPAGVLRAGENTISVGVLDTGGGGGLWGAPESRALHFANGEVVPLGEAWTYRISAPMWDLTPAPNSPLGGPNALATLNNAMIAPVAPYGIRGVLWYQGEANAGDAEAYGRLLPAMMADWRRAFASPRLPFYIAQLANFGAPSTEPQRYSWGGLRDAQRRVAAADANAGLAVTIDIGDRFDIHPTQKLVVAQRLALMARHRIYGQDVEDSGPTPVSAGREGGAIVVAFDHGPLAVYSAARPIAFELCDAARACRYVDAAVEGERVLLRGANPNDAFVRYCWGDAPVCNLYNRADLPATPFELAVGEASSP